MAKWSDTVDLVHLETYQDDDGFDREREGGPVTVYADQQSATRSEFYAASAQDKNADIAFVISLADYDGQKRIYWREGQYMVLRTYEIGSDRIQLVCSDTLNRMRTSGR